MGKQLENALKEIEQRKQYEGFLKSVIASGESLDESKTFEWFVQKQK